LRTPSFAFLTLASLAALSAANPALAAAAKATSNKTWVQPTTPDGQPSLEGTWTNATITPFERPADLAGKPVLTPEEAAALEKRAAENRADRPPKPGDVGSYNQVWFDSGTKVVATRQTSLVVDPPDGRVPLTPAAEAQRDFKIAHNADSYEYMSVWDRCITRGVPAGMFPAGYNNAYQILQTPGYVVILYEMIHETRIIPLDGGASRAGSGHISSTIRLWNGDSRGHWEGKTLVVDTTNYNNKGSIGTSAAELRVKGIPQSESLHVVERFTRTGPDTIAYEATIDDPPLYSRPWKVAFPLTRDDNYRIYEYACHEGNHAVENVLSAGRALDKAKAASPNEPRP
jgi:hypothetical protein